MADIVLKDRNGNDVTYEGIQTVTFDTPAEGVQATFTEGIAVEELEIALNFTGGDMPIAAPEGTLVKSAIIKMPEDLTPENIRSGKEIGGISGNFIGDTEEVEVELSMADGDQVISPSAVGKVLSSVTVQKPETLIPENIAEGVNIAGIVGTLAGGGMVVAGGTFTATGTTHTLEHNLGVIPIFIIVYPKSGFTSPVSGSGHFIIGFSAEGVNRLGSVNRHQYCRYYNSSMTGTKTSTTGDDVPIDTVDSGAMLENATATSVHISKRLNSGTTYQWYAFGEAA